MAQNQNFSFLNHIQSGYGDRTINNGQILPHYSIFDPNNVNGNGIISSEPTFVTPRTFARSRCEHHNGYIFQSSHLDATTGFSQQGPGGGLIEVINSSCVAANRVQVQRVINYEFPVQNQPVLPSSDILIRFSKAVRTKFLSPTSTMDRLLSQNNLTRSFVHGTLPIQLPHQITRQTPAFSSIYRDRNNQFTRQTLIFSDLEENNGHQIATRAILNPEPITTVFGSQLQGGSNPSRKFSTTFDLQGVQSRQLSNTGESRRNPRVAISSACNNPRIHQRNSNSSDDDEDYDGRTHSLCKENGSFKCPKCLEFFSSSQIFASHVRTTHYKSESPAEKKRRLLAKMKRKNKFHLVHSDYGITVVPDSPSVNEDSTSAHAP